MHKPLSPMSARARLRFIDTPPAPTDAPPAPAGVAPTPPAPAPPEPDKTFTQDDLTRIATREKEAGKRAAETELAESLGVSLDEAKKIVADAKAAGEAAKTEAQKDRDAAAKEKQDAEAEKAAAKSEVHSARLERAFAKEGIDLDGTKDEEKAKAARLLRMVTVEPGASYEDVLADVQQIKKDFPALFGAPSTTTRTAPGGDPKGTPPPAKPGEEKFAAGAARAKARYAAPETTNPLLKAAQKG